MNRGWFIFAHSRYDEATSYFEKLLKILRKGRGGVKVLWTLEDFRTAAAAATV